MLSRLKIEYTLVRSQQSLFANQVIERSWRWSSSLINFPMCIMLKYPLAELI